MAGQVARMGDKAFAYVKCGKHIIFVQGQISRASRDTFAESAGVARFGDRVTLGCGKVGWITGRTTRTTHVNGRRVALLFSSITGGGIIRAWVARASRSVMAG